MASFITYFLWLQVPTPLFFTIALSIPVALIQRLVLGALDKLYQPVSILPGRMSVISLLCWTAVFLFLIESWTTSSLVAKERECRLAPNCDHGPIRANRWREERNFWISITTLVGWVLLYRVKTVMTQLQAERRRRRAD